MSDYFDQLADTWDNDPVKIERSRITAEYCRKAPLKVKKHLLDFGGGTGLLSVFLRDTFDRITIADSSTEMLRVAREKISEAAITNIETLKINDDISEITGSYSAIVTLMTLHHINDVDRFLHSAAAILEKNGALIIADLYKEDGSFHEHVEGYSGHNGFTIEELSAKLQATGFEVVEVKEYFEIRKENPAGEDTVYPLFFMVAEKVTD